MSPPLIVALITKTTSITITTVSLLIGTGGMTHCSCTKLPSHRREKRLHALLAWQIPVCNDDVCFSTLNRLWIIHSCLLKSALLPSRGCNGAFHSDRTDYVFLFTLGIDQFLLVNIHWCVLESENRDKILTSVESDFDDESPPPHAGL